jgi:hypothetical protein
MRLRLCERCKQAFECVTKNPARFCKACVLALGLVAPHDLPHDHHEGKTHHVRSHVEIVISTSASSGTQADRVGPIWTIRGGLKTLP